MTRVKDMEPTYIPTKGVDVLGSLVCMELSYAMAQSGVFFAVEPMPDDVWSFYVKPEAVHVLERNLEIAKQAARERCKTCDADVAGHEPYNCQILKSTNSCRFIEEM